MTTTAAQKKANIVRWFGYQSDTDDIALVTAQITAAIADSDIATVIDTSCDRLLLMETRIYDQALRVPHGNLYLLNFVEMTKELRRLSNILGLPLKSNAEQVLNETATASAIAAMLSPAVTPFISLPSINYEDCILKVAPITSDTKPKNVAKGQLWNTITNPQTFEFDGWAWRGRTQGVNCGNFNIEIASEITQTTTTPIATRVAGNAFAAGAGISATPLGLVIENVRSAIAYDNTIGNKLNTSAVTGMVAIGVVNSGASAGMWGKRLLANNNDSFQKPILQTPPSGVPTDAQETWTDQSPPDFSSTDPTAINNRRISTIDPLTSVPGAYVANGAQTVGVLNLAVKTGSVAPAQGTFFTFNSTTPTGYLVNGLQAIGVSTLVVDTGGTAPQAGSTFTIGSDQTIYTIGTGATTTSWSISPALVVAAADNAVITIIPDSQIYSIGAGATTSTWLIDPPLVRAIADNTPIVIRGASLARDDRRLVVSAAGLVNYQGGKTSLVRRSSWAQGKGASGDYTYVSPTTETFYEYFENLSAGSFTKIGVCIRTVGDVGQSLKVTGIVSGAYALTIAAN